MTSVHQPFSRLQQVLPPAHDISPPAVQSTTTSSISPPAVQSTTTSFISPPAVQSTTTSSAACSATLFTVASRRPDCRWPPRRPRPRSVTELDPGHSWAVARPSSDIFCVFIYLFICLLLLLLLLFKFFTPGSIQIPRVKN